MIEVQDNEYSFFDTEQTNKPSNKVSNSCCITPSFILVALGVITMVGAAIAAWQLYSSLGNLSFVCLTATPLAIALIVYGIRKSGVKDPNSTDQSTSTNQSTLGEDKLPPWKKVKKVKASGFFDKNTPLPVKLIKMEQQIEGFSGNYAIMFGEGVTADIVFFEKNEVRYLLPKDNTIPASITLERNNLCLEYPDGKVANYHCHHTDPVEGPNGQNFTRASKKGAS